MLDPRNRRAGPAVQQIGSYSRESTASAMAAAIERLLTLPPAFCTRFLRNGFEASLLREVRRRDAARSAAHARSACICASAALHG